MREIAVETQRRTQLVDITRDVETALCEQAAEQAAHRAGTDHDDLRLVECHSQIATVDLALADPRRKARTSVSFISFPRYASITR